MEFCSQVPNGLDVRVRRAHPLQERLHEDGITYQCNAYMIDVRGKAHAFFSLYRLDIGECDIVAAEFELLPQSGRLLGVRVVSGPGVLPLFRKSCKFCMVRR